MKLCHFGILLLMILTCLSDRFIQTYGTHIIVGMAVGGQDVVSVRQTSSSTIPPTEIKGHLEDLCDYLFSDGSSLSPLQRKTREGKQKVFGLLLSVLLFLCIDCSC